MSENQFLRPIRIFDPAVDLAEDKRKKPSRVLTETGSDLFDELQAESGGASAPQAQKPPASTPAGSSDGLDVVEDENMEIIDL
ncbi:MAG: hypothetical protein KDK33_10755 [Leptospiraceae bacterium]|nr:hypothetical protein [Leptospiraceae bacterium]